MVRMWHMVRCCLVVMGFTSTLTYLGPFIYIPMTIPVRLYVQVKVDIITMYVSIIIILPIYLSSSLHCQSVVQILISLLETAETILRQVTYIFEPDIPSYGSLPFTRFPTSKESGCRRGAHREQS